MNLISDWTGFILIISFLVMIVGMFMVYLTIPIGAAVNSIGLLIAVISILNIHHDAPFLHTYINTLIVLCVIRTLQVVVTHRS